VILIDTNVWIDHLHTREPVLVTLLEQDEAAVHDLVITELSLGSIAKRREFLEALDDMRRLRPVGDDDVRWLVEKRRLWGKGLSAVDVHLLASVLSTAGSLMWTRDKRLMAAARELGVLFIERPA
jgi:pilT protein domain protein